MAAAATEICYSDPGLRLSNDVQRATSAAQGPHQHPSADRISWAALANPGPFRVPALPQLRLRRQHTPPARVTAPPPASPGRRPRQLRSQAVRSPSSSQAIKN
ncbi:hypothetical protein NDU88_004592 [Pleurodeles waltl]|uniref:Uncharacterized protein n=1 Tax=Pleurodeles waltl TaxID=8319 RepID=A0AAV7VKA7_PLEWA|nr:hypothetical protein NDU88_004592 [Pleurodeles waltl]